MLGPLLWDLAYDGVLRSALPPEADVVCYADDTLVMARGANWEEAAHHTQVALAAVLAKIRALGLRVAPNKCEAIGFRDSKRREPPEPRLKIKIEDVRIPIGSRLKYLGLILDGEWAFNVHMEETAPKMAKAAAALYRLMPNLGGPSERIRRLYANVVLSIGLYGTPVWADRVLARRNGLSAMRRVHRRLAQRAIRAYRTVAYEAATALAAMPPLELLIRQYTDIHEELRRLTEEGVALTDTVRARVKTHHRRLMTEEWPEYGVRVVGAIQPVLPRWIERRGNLTYRATQLITGHGCFGRYLCRLGREKEATYQHCGETEDTAAHTLSHCRAWAEERRVLRTSLELEEGVATLERIVVKILEDERKWRAFLRFAEQVIRAKEEAERNRERQRGGRG